MVMTTRAILIFSAMAIFGVCSASASTVQDISGDWSRGDGKARVHIAPCGAQMCAVNTWIRTPGESSEDVGDRLVMTLAPDSGSRLKGEAFDAKRDLRYSMRIVVERDHMVSEGCVLMGVVCKKMKWTRIP